MMQLWESEPKRPWRHLIGSDNGNLGKGDLPGHPFRGNQWDRHASLSSDLYDLEEHPSFSVKPEEPEDKQRSAYDDQHRMIGALLDRVAVERKQGGGVGTAMDRGIIDEKLESARQKLEEAKTAASERRWSDAQRAHHSASDSLHSAISRFIPDRYRRKADGDGLGKGDYEGHPFRGNQYAEGIALAHAELVRGRQPEGADFKDNEGTVSIDPNTTWRYRFRQEFKDNAGKATVTPDQIDGEHERKAVEAAVAESRDFWSDNSREAKTIRRADKALEEGTESARTAKVHIHTIYTMNLEDYGAGSGGRGSAKVFWGPYSAPDRDARLTSPNGYNSGGSLGVDPIYVTAHEFHHALGYDTELDLSSDVIAVGAHLRSGLAYGTEAPGDEVNKWIASVMFRSPRAGARYRAALKWLDRRYPEALERLAVGGTAIDNAEQWQQFRAAHLKKTDDAELEKAHPLEHRPDSDGWIGVDLDGTLAEHSVGHSGTIGRPIPEMVNRVRLWLAEGRNVRIFTARTGGLEGTELEDEENRIRTWCRIHLGQDLPVTNQKDRWLTDIYDDRAHHIERNTGIEKRIAWMADVLEEVRSELRKGDVPGHPFRGNQYTDVVDGYSASEASDAPWRMSKKDYIKAKGAIEPEGEYEQNREAWDKYWDSERGIRKEWERQTLAAVSEGKLSPEQANKNGLYSDYPWKPLPETMYHTTTAADAIMNEGFKSREALQQSSGHGLGGGDSLSVSFTTSREVAESIRDTMLEAKDLLNGRTTVQQLIEAARRGDGATRPFLADVLRMYGKKDGGEDLTTGLDAFLRGKELSSGMGVPPDIGDDKHYHWEPATKYAEGWMGGDGKMKYSLWERDLTEDQKLDGVFSFFKNYIAFREAAGGRMNPLFFGSDPKFLKNVDPDQIKILKVKAAPGSMGKFVASMDEYRTFSNKAVHIVGIEKLSKGDFEGHPFRGNQYTDGVSTVAEASPQTVVSPEQPKGWGTLTIPPEVKAEYENKEAQFRRVETLVHDVASKSSFPTDHVIIKREEGYVYRAGATYFRVRAEYDHDTKSVSFYVGTLSDETDEEIQGIAAHEIQHAIYRRAMDAADQDKERMLSDGVKEFTPELADKYPAQAAMRFYPRSGNPFMVSEVAEYNKLRTKLVRLDGISEYSKAYWNEYKRESRYFGGGPAREKAYERACNETLAEIARQVQMHGKLPEKLNKAWLQFYETVRKLGALTKAVLAALAKKAGRIEFEFYFTRDFKPATTDTADFVKIFYEDGSVVIAARQKPVEKYSEDQPRDERGRWSDEGVGYVSASYDKDQKQWLGEDGKPLPEHVQQAKIPANWKNVMVADKAEAKILVSGIVTSKEGEEYEKVIYHPEFVKQNSDAKFARVKEMDEKFDGMVKQVNEDIAAGRNVEEASCLRLIAATGMRPGGGSETDVYGATTLEGRHITPLKNGVRVMFIGKSSVRNNFKVTDPEIVKDLLARKAAAGDRGQLFSTSASKLSAYTGALDGGGFHTKDFRTLIGTRVALEEVAAVRKAPTTQKELRKAMLKVAKVVAERLGNKPAVCLSAYINPVVFARWQLRAA